jgi:SOS response regulatory protein OraA/RecX
VLQRKRVPAKLDQAARRRIFQHLMRRGFSADAISKALGGHNEEEG